MKKADKIFLTFLCSSIFVFLTWAAAVIVLRIQFDQNCSGHILNACNATTVELALSELRTALDYLEEKELTTGYTSILYKTEKDNVGFFYNNVKSCYEYVETLKEQNIEPFNQTLQLQSIKDKLVEELGEKNGRAEFIREPQGITRYPHNLAYCIWLNSSILLLIIGIILCFKFDH